MATKKQYVNIAHLSHTNIHEVIAYHKILRRGDVHRPTKREFEKLLKETSHMTVDQMKEYLLKEREKTGIKDVKNEALDVETIKNLKLAKANLDKMPDDHNIFAPLPEQRDEDQLTRDALEAAVNDAMMAYITTLELLPEEKGVLVPLELLMKGTIKKDLVKNKVSAKIKEPEYKEQKIKTMVDIDYNAVKKYMF